MFEIFLSVHRHNCHSKCKCGLQQEQTELSVMLKDREYTQYLSFLLSSLHRERQTNLNAREQKTMAFTWCHRGTVSCSFPLPGTLSTNSFWHELWVQFAPHPTFYSPFITQTSIFSYPLSSSYIVNQFFLLHQNSPSFLLPPSFGPLELRDSSPKNKNSVINWIRSKPIRTSFIFGTQIKMKSESFLIRHREQCNWNVPGHSAQ